MSSTVFSTVSNFLSTEESATPGSCKKWVGFFNFYFYFIFAVNSCRVLTEVPAHTKLLSCSLPCPTDPLQPHGQVVPETQHRNSALLLNLRSFNHSLSVVEVVVSFYLQMGARKVVVPPWKSGQWSFQRGNAFGMRANSCSAATPGANVSAPLLDAFPISYCSMFPISAAESTSEKRSVSVIKVFLQFWPEIPFQSQESFPLQIC